MGKLTTHVLDTTKGKPGAGIGIDLHLISGDERILLKTCKTNGDGRTDEPLLTESEMAKGFYEITFRIGEYFSEEAVFLEEVPVRFRIADETANYHVPLVCSPWSYSTYRGS